MNRISILSQFGFLSVSGVDAIKFMQGYTTCDVNKISEKNNLGAICNLKGRMITNFRIAVLGDGLLLRMHQSRVADTIKFLSPYKVFSRVEIEDVSSDWNCLGIIGAAPSNLNEGEIRAGVSDNRYEVWTKCTAQYETGAVDWSTWDCAEGLAWIETKTAEQFLPQMFYLNKLGGIDFKKGCYLGQEVIARTEYLGKLKRRLHLFHGNSSLDIGDEITFGHSKGNVVATGTDMGLIIISNANEETLLAEAPNGDSIELIPIELALNQ